MSKFNYLENRVPNEQSGEDTKAMIFYEFFYFVLFNSRSSVLYWIKDLLIFVKLTIVIRINLATVGKMRHQFKFFSTFFHVDV